MSDQPSIFDWQPPPQRHRNADPDTSVEAAVQISPRLRELQQVVLDWLRTQPEGATDDELLAAMKSTSSTYRTRRSELVDLGKVKDSGRRKLLPTRRNAIVWEVV